MIESVYRMIVPFVAVVHERANLEGGGQRRADSGAVTVPNSTAVKVVDCCFRDTLLPHSKVNRGDCRPLSFRARDCSVAAANCFPLALLPAMLGIFGTASSALGVSRRVRGSGRSSSTVALRRRLVQAAGSGLARIHGVLRVEKMGRSLV